MPDLILLIIILIMSAVVHEVSHGLAAFWLGDPTAKYAGRLTLNPLKHLDPWGSFFMPVLLLIISGGRFFFAAAKPVPYNPYNLRDQKYGPAVVGAAGPLSNIFIAVVFGIFLRIFMVSGLVPAGDVTTLLGNLFLGSSSTRIGSQWPSHSVYHDNLHQYPAGFFQSGSDSAARRIETSFRFFAYQ